MEGFDWTADVIKGGSNNSPKYLELVEVVRGLIMGDAHMLLKGQANTTARLIMSHLAHKHDMSPRDIYTCPAGGPHEYFETTEDIWVNQSNAYVSYAPRKDTIQVYRCRKCLEKGAV